MLRYFIIATVLVVGIFIGAAAVRQHERSVAAAKAAHAQRVRSWMIASSRLNGNGAVRGDAPWALSALPECMVQLAEGKGSVAVLLAHLPRGAQRVVPPVTLQYDDCTLSIAGDEALVRRGADRLRIPPVARFYRFQGGIALLRTAPCKHGHCLATLRVYRTIKP